MRRKGKLFYDEGGEWIESESKITNDRIIVEGWSFTTKRCNSSCDLKYVFSLLIQTDGNGNIVGVVVAQLNKMKFAKHAGSIPENQNFGIKASTVRQFLTSSGLPTKWSARSKSMPTRELAKIAKRQTVMVVCHQ